MATQPARGIRNNNPGNIRKSETQWEGASPVQGDDAFVTFDTPEYGIRAMARVLTTYREKYGLDTIRKIVSRWAPDVENDTEAYIKSVSSQMGVRPDARLDPGKLPDLISAIVYHENGSNPYTKQQIVRGVQMASGEAPGFTDPVTEEGAVRAVVEHDNPNPFLGDRPLPTVARRPVAPPQENIVGTDAPERTVAQGAADAGAQAGGAAVAAGQARVFAAPVPDLTPTTAEEPGAVSPAPFRCGRCGRSEPQPLADCKHSECFADAAIRGDGGDRAVAHVERPALSGTTRRNKP